MALRMSILGGGAGMPGIRTRWTFGVNGGRIGRAPDNDWILVDDERYISAHHAEVEHRAGEWWICDLSTNGTFVNGSRRPLGAGGKHRIADGDRIRLGTIHVVAEITGSNDFPADQEFDLSETALDDSFEVQSLLSGTPEGNRARPSDIYGQPLPDGGGRDGRPGMSVSGSPGSPTEGGAGPHAGQHLDNTLWPGLAAFCKGAGIDPYSLPAPARASVLQQAGQVMRETMLGLMELARARAEFSREMSVSGNSRMRDLTSPLMQVRAVEEALIQLLTEEVPGGGAVNEVRTQFAKTRHHQQSMLVAMREAMPVMLERLDPDQLERQFGGETRAAGSLEAQARYWTRYCEIFGSVVAPGETGLPPAFADEFARAYSALAYVGLSTTIEAGNSG